MAVETELYDLLGVQPNAGEAEIKKAYRRKAMEHHPDKNPEDPAAAQKFQEMASAYEILSDPQMREVYDQLGMDGLSRGGPSGMSGDAADMFAQFFGGGDMHFGFDFGPGHGPRRGKGEDTVVPYEVSLEDLYNGKAVKMSLEKEVVCGTCKGSGAKGSAKPKKCVKCDGKGWSFVQTHIGPSTMGNMRAKCTECHGEGEKLREKDRCKKCKGEKTVKEKTKQEIHVERGMADRQRIVLAGAGDQEPGIPPGDVIFVLKAQPHAAFQRAGGDLLTKATITLSEALLGFARILITHLDGRGVHVASPPGRVVKPGQTIVLRGEGMPTYKRPDQKGDMYVSLEVELPDEEWLRAVDRTALEALLPPKKAEMDPRPAVVDEAAYEESDVADVRARSFPAGPGFFDHHGFDAQFGEGGEGAWTDEDEDDEDDDGEPECRTQ